MKHLINKFLNDTITGYELEELQTWLLSKPKHQTIFKNYLNELRDVNMALQDIDSELVYTSILKRINNKPIRKLYSKWFKYAAVIMLFLGIGYFYQQGYFSSTPQLIIPSESVTLQLENGNIQILSEAGETTVIDANGKIVGAKKGNQIIYNHESIKEETLVYNTITIPYGKTFKVQLSDSTIVHLNSGTTFKYPVTFIKGEQRKVFLKGEAYFSVTKDANHPFIVNTNNVDIRVLGTKFNVSSYLEDDSINTVLVEGAVNVYPNNLPYDDKTATKLLPGYKASFVKLEKEITVNKADVEMYTSWIHGKIIFRRTTFKNIIKQLERRYNVSITCNNTTLNKEKFAATFDVETIEEILESFKKNYQIYYSINNNTIIIN